VRNGEEISAPRQRSAARGGLRMKFIVEPQQEETQDVKWPRTLCVLCPEDPRDC
jgi:hypothetical protein